MMDSWNMTRRNCSKKRHECGFNKSLFHEEQIDRLEQCKIIKSKGFEVSLNVICISHIDMDFFYDLRNKLLNNDFLDFLCFADSYGSATPDLVKKIMILFRNVSPTVKIGFHSHDNLSLAMANTITAIEYGADIVDDRYGSWPWRREFIS